ncbi:MAG TPA: sigma-70 family RNA polymerase sigma factor [Solirubrobacteraceae bacterium]|jgi:RNA polymerase sigma-70 factor (ECF subfamily)
MNVQAEEFERNRLYLRTVAQRILGSTAEAEDAVQEAWLRVNRADPDAVDNMRGWLTTIVSRICFDMLRSRRSRREELVDDWSFEFEPDEAPGPEHEALQADAIGVALLVVLDRLSPAERLAFVLHDMFGVPFEEIAPIVERAPAATRQLASRARRRVRGLGAGAEQTSAERRVIEAFLAASRNGDFEGLLAVLDPDVEFRATRTSAVDATPLEVQGRDAVARTVVARGSRFAHLGRYATVGGRPGAVVATPTRIISLVAMTIADGVIKRMDVNVFPAAEPPGPS